ncbi:MAG: T9SS type A sorting domain-containing protein [Bacteroidota bacterium]|nr:T9SS type A sorting domain-containing protein [Bacteroidota bacterium]
MSRYNNYTLSDFFCEMSMGQYDVIGDEIAVTLPFNSTYYRDLPCDRSCLNRYVLNYIDSTRNIDWTRYDKWSYINNQWVFQSDGTAEMIIMNYRIIPNNSSGWFWNPSYGGEASLAISPITFDGVTIGYFNGVTALNLLHAVGRSEIILEHEYSHKLFGCGGIPLTIDCFHTNMGLMTPAHSNTTYIMTPMERSASIVNYIPINLIDGTGIYTDTLPDYTESGISYKIKVPGTSSEYVWIANHQKKALYDGVARGGKNCYDINFGEIDPVCPDGKGLFVYREGSGCSNINQPYDIISAEGKYVWGIDRVVNVPLQIYHFPLSGNYTIFNIISGSRYNGRDEYRKSVNFTEQFLADDICSTDPNSFSVAWENRGDNFDAFNIGYDEIFSPYSNPSSSSCNPDNTGLTIALKEQNTTTGAIIVKIYSNNNSTALNDLPPSKPKNLKASKSYFGGAGSDAFHPAITWDSNIEPDFVSATFGAYLVQPEYEIYRGISYNCEVEPSYTLLATVSPSTNQYTDYNITLHDPDIDAIPLCPPTLVTCSYKILAKDNRGMRSLKSERGLVSGYTGGCADPNGSDSPASNNNNTLPDKYSVNNFPNPFNPSTKIYYALPKNGMVKINVYNTLGQKIKEIVNEFKTAGNYTVEFDGSNLSSGIFYYRIEADGFVQTKKMLLIK